MIARLRWITLLTIAVLMLAPAAAFAAECRVTSLPEIEDEVMCPICGVPLVNSGGQQAENERNFIRGLVDQCKSKDEIKLALVGEYGEEVLAMPDSDGFGLAAYLVPIGGIALAAVATAIGAVRWRRGRDDTDDEFAAEGGPPPGPDGSDLDSDLRRYDL